MGLSRQIGIDYAEGEYAIFIDSDDLLAGQTVLFELFQRREADVYSYCFVEETTDTVNHWVLHEPQFTWMFAKSYKLSFIRDNDVRAADNILWHEDTYFNQVLLAYKPKVEVIPGLVGYIWKYSPGTITRRNNAEYTSKSMVMYIDALDARLDRIRDLLDDNDFKITKINDIVYIYTTLQNFVQVNLLNTVRREIEERLAQYIKKWDPDQVLIKGEALLVISQRIAESVRGGGGMIMCPREGFFDFYLRISADEIEDESCFVPEFELPNPEEAQQREAILGIPQSAMETETELIEGASHIFKKSDGENPFAGLLRSLSTVDFNNSIINPGIPL